MEIVKVRISNILGIEFLEFDAGKFNKISGKNGQGKTSVLEALKSVFKSGNDATLIRNGAGSGEVVLVLDDGTEIKKTFSDKATLSIIDGNGDKVSKPASYLEQISEFISINPVAFLTAEKKDRTNILLNALPLKITMEQIQKAIGDFDPQINGLNQLHALVAISQIYKVIYDERTAENRSVIQTSSTITEMRGSLVHATIDPSINIADRIAELEKTQSLMNSKLSQYNSEFNQIKLDKITKSLNIKDKSISEANSSYEIKLKVLQEERDKAIQIAKNIHDKVVEDANTEYIKGTSEKQESFNAKYNDLTTELNELRTQIKNQAAYQQQFEYLNKLEKDLEVYQEKSNKLSDSLNNLNQLKTDLLKDLPIDGLEITDGEIYRNGVLFDRLNTAQQIEIAVEIAKLKAGDLPLVCVDGIERLDSETLERFIIGCKKSKLQLFITAVSDENLSIN